MAVVNGLPLAVAFFSSQQKVKFLGRSHLTSQRRHLALDSSVRRYDDGLPTVPLCCLFQDERVSVSPLTAELERDPSRSPRRLPRRITVKYKYNFDFPGVAILEDIGADCLKAGGLITIKKCEVLRDGVDEVVTIYNISDHFCMNRI